MTEITLRAVKGSPLTNEEMDTNFSNLRNAADGSLQTIPPATGSTLGGIKVGSGLTMTGEVLSATATEYMLPIATGSVLGGVKVGTGLTINGSGVMSATAVDYTLPTASAGTLGGIKVGTGLTINGSGVLTPDLNTLFSATGQQSLTSNGYQKLPGGLILQWGQYSTNTSGAATITWPIPFPAYAMHFSLQSGAGNFTSTYSSLTRFQTTINVYIASTGAIPGVACGGLWFALGW